MNDRIWTPPPKLNDSLMMWKSWNPSQHRILANSRFGIYLLCSELMTAGLGLAAAACIIASWPTFPSLSQMTSVSLTTRLTITLCFMALLMAVSIIPGHTQSDDSVLIRLVAKTPKLLQKVLHFLLYGVLTMLWVWTLNAILPESYLLVIAFTVAVLYGAAMEWYQTKVPGRFGTFLDVALNAAGAVLGLFAAILFL